MICKFENQIIVYKNNISSFQDIIIYKILEHYMILLFNFIYWCVSSQDTSEYLANRQGPTECKEA